MRGWDRWFIGRDGNPSLQFQFAEAFLRYAAFGKPDPNYDIRRFDFDKDPARLDDMRMLMNADNPDLSDFHSRGGKLIMYHGWADPSLTPLMSVDYYDRAAKANGPETSNFFRLFMVPGMFHSTRGRRRSPGRAQRTDQLGRGRQGTRHDRCNAGRGQQGHALAPALSLSAGRALRRRRQHRRCEELHLPAAGLDLTGAFAPRRSSTRL